jgi:oligoribonuclease
MAQDKDNLIWIDLEMTGLVPETDFIIEAAAVITDAQLNILAESPVLVVHQPDEVLDRMDAWNQKTHGKSGLIDRVRASTMDAAEAEAEMIAFFKKYVPKGKSPMSGNSICQDRRFLANHMPKMEEYFHYRNLDVSVFKELAKRWRPKLYNGFKKAGSHTALADILESIEELKYYREHFLRLE